MNAYSKTKQVRFQLDTKLQPLSLLRQTPVPPKGWIRAIRDSLGMSGRQLAKRMKMTKQRINRIETDEADHAITFKTMQKVAEALDCDFVYALVPRTSLEQTVLNQAQKQATKHLTMAHLTMSLEDQALSPIGQQKALDAEIEKIINTMPKALWDE